MRSKEFQGGIRAVGRRRQKRSKTLPRLGSRQFREVVVRLQVPGYSDGPYRAGQLIPPLSTSCRINRRLKLPGNGLEGFQGGVQILHDLSGQHLRFGQVLAVLQGAVPEPQKIQIQLVALRQFVVLERPPPAAIVLRAPRRLPLVALARSVAGHEVVEAHQFFRDQIDQWLGEGDQGLDDGSTSTERAEALEQALSRLLELVVIDLLSSDDPHIIFETLNARGTPLRQSDLMKNMILHEARLHRAQSRSGQAEAWARGALPARR